MCACARAAEWGAKRRGLACLRGQSGGPKRKTTPPRRWKIIYNSNFSPPSSSFALSFRFRFIPPARSLARSPPCVLLHARRPPARLRLANMEARVHWAANAQQPLCARVSASQRPLQAPACPSGGENFHSVFCCRCNAQAVALAAAAEFSRPLLCWRPIYCCARTQTRASPPPPPRCLVPPHARP